jgi:hypothetical protein
VPRADVPRGADGADPVRVHAQDQALHPGVPDRVPGWLHHPRPDLVRCLLSVTRAGRVGGRYRDRGRQKMLLDTINRELLGELSVG